MSEVEVGTVDVDARGRPRVQTVNDEPSRTIQSDAGEADIKKILKRHGVTGVIEHLNQAELVYGDVSNFTDYADAMRQVSAAEEAFLRLPSKVREVFRHDAATWLDAANDGLSDGQRSKLEELGFLEPEAPEAAPTEPVGDPPASE